jgi:hypothetical protein
MYAGMVAHHARKSGEKDKSRKISAGPSDAPHPPHAPPPAQTPPLTDSEYDAWASAAAAIRSAGAFVRRSFALGRSSMHLPSGGAGGNSFEVGDSADYWC